MAIEKGLYAAPQGIAGLGEEGDVPELEIEIEDRKSTRLNSSHT